MTAIYPYNVRMNILSLHKLLISLPAQGLLWFLLLFLVCIFGVHIARLVQLGWAYKTEKENSSEKKTAPSPPEKPKEEKKAPAETPQEPIYYIVERKTRRAKATYGEPKRIDFKK